MSNICAKTIKKVSNMEKISASNKKAGDMFLAQMASLALFNLHEESKKADLIDRKAVQEIRKIEADIKKANRQILKDVAIELKSIKKAEDKQYKEIMAGLDEVIKAFDRITKNSNRAVKRHDKKAAKELVKAEKKAAKELEKAEKKAARELVKAEKKAAKELANNFVV